jgi:hypothetical protein
MPLIAIALEISSFLAGDGWAGKRGQFGRRIAALASTTSGVIVVGALSYGLAAEGWRLAGLVRSAAGELVGRA